MNVREAFEKSYKKYDDFLNRIIIKIIQLCMNNGFIYSTHNSYRIKERIVFITHEAFGSALWTENDYLHALYGAIEYHGSFLDFKHFVDSNIEEIHNYFERYAK